jgi:hypothetical protein
MTWIPLHVHSHWSLLDGVPSIPELIDFAQVAGLPALTDSLLDAVHTSALRQPYVSSRLVLTRHKRTTLFQTQRRCDGPFKLHLRVPCATIPFTMKKASRL